MEFEWMMDEQQENETHISWFFFLTLNITNVKTTRLDYKMCLIKIT